MRPFLFLVTIVKIVWRGLGVSLIAPEGKSDLVSVQRRVLRNDFQIARSNRRRYSRPRPRGSSHDFENKECNHPISGCNSL